MLHRIISHPCNEIKSMKLLYLKHAEASCLEEVHPLVVPTPSTHSSAWLIQPNRRAVWHNLRCPAHPCTSFNHEVHQNVSIQKCSAGVEDDGKALMRMCHQYAKDCGCCWKAPDSQALMNIRYQVYIRIMLMPTLVREHIWRCTCTLGMLRCLHESTFGDAHAHLAC